MGIRKPIKLKGLSIPFNVENKNGRIYSKESFTKECILNIKENIKKDILLGEFNSEYNESEVSLTNVSHRVTAIEIKDDGLHTEIEILETPHGKMVKHLIDSIELGGELPFSIASRSMGTINKDKTVNVDKIISFDIISKENSSFDQSFIELVKDNNEKED